jgi:hypothetical protein
VVTFELVDLPSLNSFSRRAISDFDNLIESIRQKVFEGVYSLEPAGASQRIDQGRSFRSGMAPAKQGVPPAHGDIAHQPFAEVIQKFG